MANRFFTILVVPEKTSGLKRIVIPSWIVKGAFVVALFGVALAGMMLLDYWYVMDQIDENKLLKIEGRRLRQQVQIYKNRISTIESTMDRIQTFETRLRVITNIEDRENLVQRLNEKLPDAATNIGGPTDKDTAEDASNNIAEIMELGDDNPEKKRLKSEEREMEGMFSKLNHKTLIVEQNLQDLYELLADQRNFLAALPTRKPANGFFTSGFGIRPSPYGGRKKMHEGLDIANWPGTPIWSTANGNVRYAGPKSGYGRTVIIDHGYGLETWYAHVRKLMVKTGQKVVRGQQIATMGSTGRSTGPHLHYEVRVNGIPVDPLSYVLEE